ncbi:MAG TPA: histidine kinase, partial [Burkholderiaceae bacterium]
IWLLGNLIVLALGGIPGTWNVMDDLSLALGRMLSLGTLTFVHATWRGEQRALAALRRGEIEQAARQRAVETARLLALQARVEPEFLFDTLGRVNRLARRSTAAADRLLMALTHLLRALQGGGAQAASSLQRELSLVSAYARTSARSGLRPPRLLMSASAQARATALAPGVLLPLLRDLARHGPSRWRLDAHLEADALAIAVVAEPADAAARHALAGVDQPSLLARLRGVHGPGARLAIAERDAACGLHLHLPVPDDRQGPDR